MSFTQSPVYILTILFLLIGFAEWLATKKYFRHLGAVLIVILSAAVLANLQIIPSSGNAPAIYDQIFKYATPLGIFFLLLGVKLSDIKQAGLPMLTMFFIGAAATVMGVLIGYWLTGPQEHMGRASVVAGMFTGTYIGGSANLNAVALQYGMLKEGNLFAAINASDNILTTFWMLMTILLPPILQKILPRKKMKVLENSNASITTQSSISVRDLTILLALGFGSLAISFFCKQLFPSFPDILVLTTLALLLAQLPFIQRIQGATVMGMILIMLFLAIIGAYCDLRTLAHNGALAWTLLSWDTFIVLIHGLLIFILGGILRQDWDLIGVASNANIGGASSAPACAASLSRPDLQLPGILVGSLGLALGTYIGILVTELLT